MTEFQHCDHDIECERVDTIQGHHRTRWTCRRCRAFGMIDLPDGSHAGTVDRSFVVALERALLVSVQLRNRQVMDGNVLAAVREHREARARERRNRKRATQLYIIRNEGTGHLKIGISHDPQSRMRNLQIGSPQPLSLVATVQGEINEADVHERFASARVGGEWFRPTPELLAWIEECRR